MSPLHHSPSRCALAALACRPRRRLRRPRCTASCVANAPSRRRRRDHRRQLDRRRLRGLGRRGAVAATSPFTVTNTGDEVTEFYLLAEDGLRIVGEVENIGPGLTRDLVVQAAPGHATSPPASRAWSATGIRAAFTVTDSGTDLAPDGRPSPSSSTTANGAVRRLRQGPVGAAGRRAPRRSPTPTRPATTTRPARCTPRRACTGSASSPSPSRSATSTRCSTCARPTSRRARRGPAGTASRRTSGRRPRRRRRRYTPRRERRRARRRPRRPTPQELDDQVNDLDVHARGARSATAPRSCSTRSPPARSPARRRSGRTPTCGTSRPTSTAPGSRSRSCAPSLEAKDPALAADARRAVRRRCRALLDQHGRSRRRLRVLRRADRRTRSRSSPTRSTPSASRCRSSRPPLVLTAAGHDRRSPRRRRTARAGVSRRRPRRRRPVRRSGSAAAGGRGSAVAAGRRRRRRPRRRPRPPARDADAATYPFYGRAPGRHRHARAGPAALRRVRRHRRRRATSSSTLLQRWTAAAARLTPGEPVGPYGPRRGPYDAPPDDTGEALGPAARRPDPHLRLRPDAVRRTPTAQRPLRARRPAARGARRAAALPRRQPRPRAQRRRPRASRRAPTTRRSPCTPSATSPASAFGTARDALVAARVRPHLVDVDRRRRRRATCSASRTAPPTSRPRRPATLDEHVWVAAGRRPSADWLTGGSYLVARRIRMHIETWDRTSLREQEGLDRPRPRARARRSSGGTEFTEPDFDATGPATQPLIAARRARAARPPRRTTTACGCCAAATTSPTATTRSGGSTPGCSSSPSCATRARSTSRCRTQLSRPGRPDGVPPAHRLGAVRGAARRRRRASLVVGADGTPLTTPAAAPFVGARPLLRLTVARPGASGRSPE